MGITVALSPAGGWLSVLAVMLATGLAVGTVNGVLIVKGRIPQPLIVTVATLGIVRGVALLVSDGGTRTGFPDPVVTAGSGFVGPLPVPVLLVSGLALLLYVVTTKTQWGRWIFAVGGNPDAARRLGVPADRVLVSVYVICGCTAAFAGILTAGRTNAGSPFSGELLELDAITAVIIGGASLFGGRGSVGNVVVGALILGVIRNGLDLLDVAPFWQGVAIGCVILVALELDAGRAALERRFQSAQGRDPA
jgi:ribose transport system permease protein